MENEKKERNLLLWVLAILGVIAAVAGCVYAIYRYLNPNYLKDIDDELDEDYEEDSEDDEDYFVEEDN